MPTFTGKTILIVGASSGIGHALAQHLLAEGASLITVGRRAPEGIESLHLNWDVTQPAGETFAQLPEVIHGLVYCPGTINLKPFQRLQREDYDRDLQINVLGAIETIKAAFTSLKKPKNASIILFSTVAVKLGMGLHSSVSVAKAAVEGLTRSLAAEFAPHNIRVNALAPSLTDTPLAEPLLEGERRDAANKRHPLGRVGTTQDMAAMAAFLLSDQATWITGQVIGVDGGMGSLK